jgi:serine/threonine protein kinase
LFTQLLEGIAHLNRNGIAHRDLKMDNLLLDTTTDLDYPHLTITDFGCCLADKANGLQLPFPSNETDRGGNAALMAPEVASAKPGTWKKISYEKSDAWAAGTLAYEIFGKANPFVRESASAAASLDSRTYKDGELPTYEDIPIIVQSLIHELLRRNPNERLNAELAATICQLYLWCPTNWLVKSGDKVSNSEVGTQNIFFWPNCGTD